MQTKYAQAIELQVRQLLFWNFFLFDKEKSALFLLFERRKRVAPSVDGRRIKILLTPHPSLRDTFSLWRRLM